MHIGYSPIFQNLYQNRTDRDVFVDEMKLVDLAEPLGFESIWQPEHHFTRYEMTPNVLQFLSHVAGRTKTAKLGSMAVIVPWHDPLRVAEQAVLLDHMSDGRLLLGLGRGLGAVEFDGFRVDMETSRVRFQESAEAITAAIANGYMEYSGSIIKQPRVNLRPAPFKSFDGRLFGAGLSPETGPLLARLGLTPMIFPLKKWEDVQTSLHGYTTEWRNSRPDVEPPQCMLVGFCHVDKDPVRAKEVGERYIANYYNSVLEHYDLAGDRIKQTKGYEFYSDMGNGQHDAAAQSFVGLMPYGTPAQVIEKIREINKLINNNILVVHFLFGGIPFEDAQRSMKLFAAEVLPAIKAIKTPEPFVHARQRAAA